MLIGVPLILIGIYIQISHYIYVHKKGYKDAIGVIIRIEERILHDYDYGDSIYYCPIIEYVVDGNSYTIEGQESTKYKNIIGYTVNIMYDPMEPHEAIVRNNKRGYLCIFYGIIASLLTWFIFER